MPSLTFADMTAVHVCTCTVLVLMHEQNIVHINYFLSSFTATAWGRLKESW